MFDTVDIGNGAGHEIAGHGLHPFVRTPNPKNQKALPSGRKSSGSAHVSRGRASTLPASISTVGPEHSNGGGHSYRAHGRNLMIKAPKINWMRRANCANEKLRRHGGPRRPRITR